MSWKVDTTQKKAAWSLYVELVTRIAVQTLEVDQGLVREAMNSLYSLFGTTREVLKAAGPDVGASRDSVGGIAMTYPPFPVAIAVNQQYTLCSNDCTHQPTLVINVTMLTLKVTA
ncbi:hypothetical protein [Nostoc flagelliforme]|uniref:hypothetical protein n=1 Tax=Nostoc flagelliforme TaxID=1306274 RepID=UPI001F552DA4|nr:hypothetical protein [Nostoc flagelliforme]